MVRLVPHRTPPIQPRDPKVFAQIVKAAFANRRKMLRNNLREIAGAECLDALGIDAQRRAETLTIEEFARIADAIVADG